MWEALGWHKLGVVVHTCNPALGTERQEGKEFVVTLSYLVSQRPARVT